MGYQMRQRTLVFPHNCRENPASWKAACLQSLQQRNSLNCCEWLPESTPGQVRHIPRMQIEAHGCHSDCSMARLQLKTLIGYEPPAPMAALEKSAGSTPAYISTLIRSVVHGEEDDRSLLQHRLRCCKWRSSRSPRSHLQTLRVNTRAAHRFLGASRT